MRIRAARWEDKNDIATLIADAVNPGPLADWLVSDPEQRRQLLVNVLAIWVEHAMFFGDIHVTDDLTAATVGFHRYWPIPPPSNYRVRLADAAGAHCDRFDLLNSLLSTRQPTSPHYHLAFMAVRQSAQRVGVGAALLAHHRDRLDSIDLPSWTTTPTGREHLLARYGYTPQPTITLPDGPTLYPMRRNARNSSRPASADAGRSVDERSDL